MEFDIELLAQAVINMTKPRVERIGVSKIRMLTGHVLRKMEGPIFIEIPHRSTPVAVVIKYEDYLRVQQALFGIN
jgi:hypothetical protein